MAISHNMLEEAVRKAGEKDPNDPFRYDEVKELLGEITPEMNTIDLFSSAMRAYIRDPSRKNLIRVHRTANEHNAEMRRLFQVQLGCKCVQTN